MSGRRQLNHHHYVISPTSSSASYVTAHDSRLLHWRYDNYTDRNFRIHGQTLLYLFILFSIILLTALLLLYARWFFRLRHPLVLQVPPQQPKKSSNGLDRAEIDRIPIVLYQSSAGGGGDGHTNNNNNNDGFNDEVECCICLAMFVDGDKVKVLPRCEHRYHSDCVDLWLAAGGSSSCPLCRLPVRVQALVDPSSSPPPPPV